MTVYCNGELSKYSGYTSVVLIKYHTLNVNSNPIFTSAKEDMSSPLFVCLFVCLSVCLLATLCKNFLTDLHEIFREGWQWADEQMTKFWWRSGSGIRIRIRIAILVRRALAEVYDVPVFLVFSLLLPSSQPCVSASDAFPPFWCFTKLCKYACTRSMCTVSQLKWLLYLTQTTQVLTKYTADFLRHESLKRWSWKVQFSVREPQELKPNSITLASSELAPSMFEAGSCQIPLH